MATNIGDFVANFRADTSDFVSGIKDAKAEVYLFNTGLRETWQEAVTDAHKAATGIKSGAERSVSAIQRLWSSVSKDLSPELKKNVEESYEVAAANDESSSTMANLANMAAKAAIAAETAALGWLAYELVIKETASAIGDHLKEGAALRKSLENVTSTAMSTAGAIGSTLVESFRASMNAAIMFATGFGSITEIVDAGAATVTQWANSTAAAFASVEKYAATAANTFATALAIWHGADANQAAAFHEEGIALREVADQTEKVIAKQQAQRDSFQFLQRVQADAIATTERAAEVAKVQSLFTVEAVDAEVRALQQRSAQAILNGQTDDNWRKQTEALFVALEKQREGIKNGTIIDKEAEAARKQAAQQAEEAARKQQQLNDQGIDRIARLKDQIDILNGAATEAEVAMREMARAGFSQDQIQEVGRLTEELNRLKEEAKADGTDEKAMKTRKQREIDTGPAAVLKGTSSAFSAIFGAGRKTDDRTAKATETTVVELKKLNNNILKMNNGPQIVGGGAI